MIIFSLSLSICLCKCFLFTCLSFLYALVSMLHKFHVYTMFTYCTWIYYSRWWNISLDKSAESERKITHSAFRLKGERKVLRTPKRKRAREKKSKMASYERGECTSLREERKKSESDHLIRPQRASSNVFASHVLNERNRVKWPIGLRWTQCSQTTSAPMEERVTKNMRNTDHWTSPFSFSHAFTFFFIADPAD